MEQQDSPSRQWVIGGVLLGAVALGGILYFRHKRFCDTEASIKHIRVLVTEKDRTLTPEFKVALARIFNEELDLDRDGALNDQELDNLLLRAQGNHLTSRMKQFVAETFDTNEDGSLTLEGFIASYQWVIDNLNDERATELAIQRDLAAFGYTYGGFQG